MSPVTANFFWHGAPPSLYEKACLLSFARNGFDVRVHSFDALELPAGATRVDANAVARPEEIEQRTQMGIRGCLSSFSNIFRYRLLSRAGGWWFDADVFCLADSRRFRELQKHSRGILVGYETEAQINGAVIYASDPGIPAELERLAVAKGDDLEWGEIGPHLITQYHREHPDRVTVLPPPVFYPVPFHQIDSLWDPDARSRCEDAAAASLCVHLINELRRRRNIPKDIMPPSGSYLESLFSSVGMTTSPEARLPLDFVRLPAKVASLIEDNDRLRRENARLGQDNDRLRQRIQRTLSCGTWRVGSALRTLARPLLALRKRGRSRRRPAARQLER